jgi:predicted enzyme involved in methoxymalonyl-ACP biosynthesis
LRATYIPTKKNGVITTLFESLGFSPLEGDGNLPTGASRWHLDLEGRDIHRTHITRKAAV